ncbi:MAG: hypothetical protein AAGA65_05650 [Actinomycetota bacterium]
MPRYSSKPSSCRSRGGRDRARSHFEHLATRAKRAEMFGLVAVAEAELDRDPDR